MITRDDQLTLHACCQAPHLLRRVLASETLRLPEDQLRIMVSDMGGGFGARITPYPEEALVLYAARKLRRPVRWQADRSELFFPTIMAAIMRAIVRWRWTPMVAFWRCVRTYWQIWAPIFPISARRSPRILETASRPASMMFPALHIRCALHSHQYGADWTISRRRPGRRQSIGLSGCSTLLRPRSAWIRSNCAAAISCRSTAMPYRTAAGAIYDSGDFVKVLRQAVAALPIGQVSHSRRAAARRRGRLLGRGVACHIDTTSGLEPGETVSVEADTEGAITLLSGTQAMGQGLATVYTQMAAARLGVCAQRDQTLAVQAPTPNASPQELAAMAHAR